MDPTTWNLRFFTPEEFPGGVEHLSPRLLTLLDNIRFHARVPIYVTSAFRDGDDGAHGRGLAVDISDNLHGADVGSRWRHSVLRALYAYGVRRVGVYDRHIHFDIAPDLPLDVTWAGKST